MTSVAVVDRAGRTWLSLSWSRLARWATVLLPVALAVVALQLAAPGQRVWPTAFVVVLALGAGLVPDSSIGLMTIAGFIAWWVYAVPPGAVEWALVAAISLLAFHVALALAAAGPAGTTVGRRVTGRLLLRLLLVTAATVAVAAVAILAAGRFTSTTLVVAATLLAIGLLPVAVARR